MTQVIEVTVSPQGETTVQTKGFTGANCRDATRQLEAALGLCQAEQLTGEFYHRTGVTHETRQST